MANNMPKRTRRPAVATVTEYISMPNGLKPGQCGGWPLRPWERALVALAASRATVDAVVAPAHDTAHHRVYAVTGKPEAIEAFEAAYDAVHVDLMAELRRRYVTAAQTAKDPDAAIRLMGADTVGTGWETFYAVLGMGAVIAIADADGVTIANAKRSPKYVDGDALGYAIGTAMAAGEDVTLVGEEVEAPAPVKPKRQRKPRAAKAPPAEGAVNAANDDAANAAA